MTQASLFAPGEVDPAPTVGDPDEACYTPPRLADAVLERVLQRCPASAVKRVVEPSVGGGAFVRAVNRRLPKAVVTGVDRNPFARGLLLADETFVGDTLEWCKGQAPGRFQLMLGNFPFSVALEHIVGLLGLRPYRLAVVVPQDRISRPVWREVIYDQPVEGMRCREMHPIAERPWPDLVREVALLVFGADEPRCSRVWGDPIDWRWAA